MEPLNRHIWHLSAEPLALFSNNTPPLQRSQLANTTANKTWHNTRSPRELFRNQLWETKFRLIGSSSQWGALSATYQSSGRKQKGKHNLRKRTPPDDGIWGHCSMLVMKLYVISAEPSLSCFSIPNKEETSVYVWPVTFIMALFRVVMDDLNIVGSSWNILWQYNFGIEMKWDKGHNDVLNI